MNSFVLMATVIRNPELRFTQDNQTPVCDFLVEFPGLRDDAPKETLKVVGWGNLANTISDSYHPGDRLLIEGRLSMNMIDRQEGFKEKRAELVASRIHRIDHDPNFTAPPPGPSNVVQFPASSESRVPTPRPVQDDIGGNLDDIPF
ncbi:MAG: single-stranded DNA-binding protein [Synechocystis sp.]|nr:single-stranded DNA-binding protein [Synechocystis sp.]